MASVEGPSVDVLTRVDELVVQDQEITSSPVFEHFAEINCAKGFLKLYDSHEESAIHCINCVTNPCFFSRRDVVPKNVTVSVLAFKA